MRQAILGACQAPPASFILVSDNRPTRTITDESMLSVLRAENVCTESQPRYPLRLPTGMIDANQKKIKKCSSLGNRLTMLALLHDTRYAVVRDANADAQVWGNLLIQARFAASITTGPCTIPPLTSGLGPGESRQCVRPDDTKPIVSMSDRLTSRWLVRWRAPTGEQFPVV